MSLSGFLPAVSRRAIVMASAAALVGAVSGSSLRAQGTAAPPQTPATPPPAAQAAPGDPLKFDTPAARVVILTCTDDAGQAMAEALAKAKDVLGKSAKPEDKAQAAHWKVLKGAQAGNTVFVFVLDQTSSGVSYNPFVILQNAGLPAAQYASEITPLFTRVNGGLKGLVALDGTISDMAAAAGGGTR
jgi:hypothetical protein